MSRQSPDHAQVTWRDLMINVAERERASGVKVEMLLTFDCRLSAGACVEVVLREANTVGRGAELVRVREPFPAGKASGQAGAALWAVSCAFRAMELEPWLWPRKMREAAQGKA